MDKENDVLSTGSSVSPSQAELLQARRQFTEVEQKLEYLNRRLEAMQSDIEERTKILNSGTLPSKEQFDFEQALLSLEEKRDALYADIRSHESIREGLLKIIQQPQYYNKLRLFANIRELLKRSGGKLGQIEREAGFQPGYMSRLEKPGNTTEPTLSFLAAASKELGVPVDYLMYADMENMTPAEERLLSFFQKLIEDTREGILLWEAASANVLTGFSREIPKKELAQKNPLIMLKTNPDPFVDKDEFYYTSYFFRDKEVKLHGVSYSAVLKGAAAEIYIMQCSFVGQEGKNVVFKEVYLADKQGRINPVCCTAKTVSAIEAAVNSLYNEIGAAEIHAHLGKDTWSIIDAYLDPQRNSARKGEGAVR